MTEDAEGVVLPPAGSTDAGAGAPKRPRFGATTLIGGVALLLVVVVGVTMTVSARAARSRAEHDLASATAVLPQRQQAQKNAEADLAAAQQRRTTVRENARSAAKQARTVLPTAADLAAVDERRVAINKVRRDQIARGDIAGYNSQVDIINELIKRKNALHDQLRVVFKR